jgi:hypothetical protein
MVPKIRGAFDPFRMNGTVVGRWTVRQRDALVAGFPLTGELRMCLLSFNVPTAVCPFLPGQTCMYIINVASFEYLLRFSN